MLEEHLVEILLGTILTFNIGAYGFLWRKVREVESGVEDNNTMVKRLAYRIFGIDDDQTDSGHLVETEERFEYIHEKLEEISDKIDKTDEERKKEHKQVRQQMKKLINDLSEEDEIQVRKGDYSLD